MTVDRIRPQDIVPHNPNTIDLTEKQKIQLKIQHEVERITDERSMAVGLAAWFGITGFTEEAEKQWNNTLKERGIRDVKIRKDTDFLYYMPEYGDDLTENELEQELRKAQLMAAEFREVLVMFPRAEEKKEYPTTLARLMFRIAKDRDNGLWFVGCCVDRGISSRERVSETYWKFDSNDEQSKEDVRTDLSNWFKGNLIYPIQALPPGSK